MPQSPLNWFKAAAVRLLSISPQHQHIVKTASNVSLALAKYCLTIRHQTLVVALLGQLQLKKTLTWSTPCIAHLWSFLGLVNSNKHCWSWLTLIQKFNLLFIYRTKLFSIFMFLTSRLLFYSINFHLNSKCIKIYNDRALIVITHCSLLSWLNDELSWCA